MVLIRKFSRGMRSQMVVITVLRVHQITVMRVEKTTYARERTIAQTVAKEVHTNSGVVLHAKRFEVANMRSSIVGDVDKSDSSSKYTEVIRKARRSSIIYVQNTHSPFTRKKGHMSSNKHEQSRTERGKPATKWHLL